MKTEKIRAALVFVEEQLQSLKRNQFNGTFTVRFGYKDGGIAAKHQPDYAGTGTYSRQPGSWCKWWDRDTEN
jgi:hypothetical protein